MATTLTYTQELVTHSCPSCGVEHAIPKRLEQKALDNRGPRGRQIYCPNGHTWHFVGKTEAERLQEQLDQREGQLARERQRLDQAEAEIAHQKARANGYKGAAAKTKKRAAKGVCPAPGCKRSFVDVARHVATCHPNLDAEAVEG